MKKYLFITGCSRSGTSVLADLLRSDSRILMGRERFARVRRNHPEDYSVSLFEQDRFCRQLKQGDSHHKELDDYYERAYKTYDSFEFIGDKDPNLFEGYDLLLSKFPNVKIVYIIRNIIEVAHSFELRALKTKFDHGVHNVPDNVWPISRNWESAVSEWNYSIEQTRRFSSKLNIHILPYENLFSDENALIRMYAFLGLDFKKSVINFWYQQKKYSQKLESNRNLSFSSLQLKTIIENSDILGYRELLSLAD